MTGKELLDRMDLIDPAYVAAADLPPKKRRRLPGWLAVAACLPVLLLLTRYGIPPVQPEIPTDPTIHATEPQQPPETTQDQNTDPIPVITEPAFLWEPYYNSAGEFAISSDVRINIPSYFAEELTDQELDAILPGNLRQSWHSEGYAGFSGAAGLVSEAELMLVSLSFRHPESALEVSLGIWKYDYPDCAILPAEPLVSHWDGTDYILCEYPCADGQTHLSAKGEREDWFWYFNISAPTERTSDAKDALEAVICSFDAVPDFSTIRADRIPEYRNDPLSFEDARNDPDFGAWFLPELPAGFQRESIRRYRDYRLDYLSGLWTRGYDEIYWQVAPIAEEDRIRITSVTDTEHYDLSLYPIPRAESVPEELREIVDNPIFRIGELTLDAVRARAYRIHDAGDTDGWRMDFSVLYGDILVKVRTKGVDPEWLYGQLKSVAE